MINRVEIEQTGRKKGYGHVTIITVGLSQDMAEGLAEQLEKLGHEVHARVINHHISSRRRPHLPAQLLKASRVLAFVDFGGNPTDATVSVQYLRQALGSRLTAISVSEKPEGMLDGMRAGCTDLLADPLAAEELAAIVDRSQSSYSETTSSSVQGSVLALLGAKGGVGTTTIAVHLAAYLAQVCDKKVLLIDNQAQFGHVCIYLGIDGASCHFQEVVRNVGRLDSELLRGFIAKHPSGVDVLSSPDVGESARVMHPEDVRETLDFLRGEYDFIVVDCAGRLDEVSRAVVDAAEQVYVVATPEISALRDLSRYIDELVKNADDAKVKVVINRFSSQFAVNLAEIEKAIRMPVTFSVPNSFLELVRSANLGSPLSASLKNGFTNEMCRWAKMLAGDPEETMSRDTAATLRSHRAKFETMWHGLKSWGERWRGVKGTVNG